MLRRGYVILKSIHHKDLNLLYDACEITFGAIPGSNQYLAMRLKGKDGLDNMFVLSTPTSLLLHRCMSNKHTYDVM